MKSKMISSFVQVFMIVFIVLLFFSVVLSVTYFEGGWYSELFSAEIFHFPYLFYLFIFSFIASLIYTLRNVYRENEQTGEVEEYLRYLANGDYSENLYMPLIKGQEGKTNENREIADLLLRIRELMMELSKEAQDVFKKEENKWYQSKEEILEEERHRIARELHDSVSQQLFAAMMMLSAINQQKDQLPKKYQEHLQLIQNILNESQSEMRALLLHLRPVKLEGKSLRKGIEQLLQELKTKTSIKIIWSVEDVSLNPTIENHLFRIIQELLSNTLRHAKADLLEVYLTENNQNVLLKVVDDGVGFNTEENKSGSYGLKNIRERIFSMGGSVKILSFKNKGTSVEIKVPII